MLNGSRRREGSEAPASSRDGTDDGRPHPRLIFPTRVVSRPRRLSNRQWVLRHSLTSSVGSTTAKLQCTRTGPGGRWVGSVRPKPRGVFALSEFANLSVLSATLDVSLLSDEPPYESNQYHSCARKKPDGPPSSSSGDTQPRISPDQTGCCQTEDDRAANRLNRPLGAVLR